MKSVLYVLSIDAFFINIAWEIVMLLWSEINKNIFPWYFFNMDISVAIALVCFKFSHIILDIYMEGTVSQIFDIGSSSYFIKM